MTVRSTWATVTSGKEKLPDPDAYNRNMPGIMIGGIAPGVLLVVSYIASLFFAGPAMGARDMTLWGWLDKRKAARVQALRETVDKSEASMVNNEVCRKS